MNLAEKAKRLLEIVKKLDGCIYAMPGASVDVKELCQAVVDSESVMRYAIGPTRDVKTRHFKDWLSRYASEALISCPECGIPMPLEHKLCAECSNA